MQHAKRAAPTLHQAFPCPTPALQVNLNATNPYVAWYTTPGGGQQFQSGRVGPEGSQAVSAAKGTGEARRFGARWYGGCSCTWPLHVRSSCGECANLRRVDLLGCALCSAKDGSLQPHGSPTAAPRHRLPIFSISMPLPPPPSNLHIVRRATTTLQPPYHVFNSPLPWPSTCSGNVQAVSVATPQNVVTSTLTDNVKRTTGTSGRRLLKKAEGPHAGAGGV